MTRSIVPAPEHIARDILVLRGQRVLLDAHLAALYDVTTKRLNEQVKRNAERFPDDFMFRLTRSEVEALNRSQIATGSQKHRDPRFLPFAFTEHGAIQPANVLNSSSHRDGYLRRARLPAASRNACLQHRARPTVRSTGGSSRQEACRP